MSRRRRPMTLTTFTFPGQLTMWGLWRVESTARELFRVQRTPYELDSKVKVRHAEYGPKAYTQIRICALSAYTGTFEDDLQSLLEELCREPVIVRTKVL